MLLREVRVRLENADFDELLVGCEDLEAVKRQIDEARSMTGVGERGRLGSASSASTATNAMTNAGSGRTLGIITVPASNGSALTVIAPAATRAARRSSHAVSNTTNAHGSEYMSACAPIWVRRLLTSWPITIGTSTATPTASTAVRAMRCGPVRAGRDANDRGPDAT